MNSTFARRLWLVTSLEIGAAFGVLVLAGAIFALGAYVGTLRADFTSTLDRMVGALGGPATHDARVAGNIVAARYPRATVSILLIDQTWRVVVAQPAASGRAPHVDIRPRGDNGADRRPDDLFSRLVLGLVTAIGLAPERAHVGTVDIIVRANQSALVATVARNLPAFFVAFALALALAVVLARALTVQALRPLVEVERALARFAAGDLSPQFVAEDRRHQLGSLARAYNGAIEQMEHAFGERERANAAMRQFIADAGHQLRTPLTVVRGFISILRKGDLRSPSDAERILESMHRQSLVMASLIDKLMLLDRWEEPREAALAEKIDVARLARDVLGPIADSHPTRDVRVDAPEVGLVGIDPTDFAHALTNIVDNALKYTTGSIDVCVRRDGRDVVVNVADCGPGMSPAEAAHACDRFFRGARRDVEGSGLGLSIARRAVERAGGTLEIESDPQAGSTFRISLPIGE